MPSLRIALGWTLVALAALVVAFEVWGPAWPAGPEITAPAAGLLEVGPGWALHAATLALAAVLAGAGLWLLLRDPGPRDGGGA